MKTNKKFIIGNTITVIWRDSNMYITQMNIDDEFEIAEITSIGQLITVDKDKIVLAGDLLANGEVRRVIVIPRENIISI